jgi:hypothetical protein
MAETMIAKSFLMLTLALAAARVAIAADQPSLNPHLEPLRPLLGKTWKGEFKNSTPDKPMIDIEKWERALNGQAVRLTHSINGGMYGGETLFIWDDKKQAITYFYFTTASFRTEGILEIKDGKFTTLEEVKGDAGGVTEVRATCDLTESGGFHVKAEHKKDGQWNFGHEVTYKVDPSSEVVFK